MLLQTCSLLETDNVCEQITERIFKTNGGYCFFMHAYLHEVCIERTGVDLDERKSVT